MPDSGPPHVLPSDSIGLQSAAKNDGLVAANERQSEVGLPLSSGDGAPPAHHRREKLPPNLFQGSDVAKVVRRATQYELAEEIDPKANFVAHGKLLAYAPVSLHFFDETSQFRQFFVWLVNWSWFERVVLLAILLNSLALAVTDYSIDAVDLATLQPSGEDSPINAFVESTEPIFTAIFTIECLCKILAQGFVMDEGSYLRDGWHVLDFLVVFTSLLQAFVSSANVSALRAFRVLRPLRAMSRAKGMRIMIKSLFAAIPSLANVGILLGFVFVLYAILGLNLFSGITHSRCRLTSFPVSVPASHMQVWYAPEPGNVQLSSLPWVQSGDFQGFSPASIAAMTGGSNGSSGSSSGANSSLLASLNSTVFPAGQRQPLYFEAVGRYFSGNEPEESLYEAAVVNQEYYAGNPVTEVPWSVKPEYWLPFPVAANYLWQLVNNRTAFPFCGAAEQGSGSGGSWPAATGIPLDEDDWNQQTSPWREPRMCVWLINDDDQSVCSLSGGGINTCQLPLDLNNDLPSHVPANTLTANQTLSLRFTRQTCGSNFDSFGNPRFANARFMQSESAGNDLEDGLVTFDNIGTAFLLLYQSLLQQGWSGIMQWYMDSYSLPWVASLIFVSFNLVGALFLCNLVIAAIFLEFSAAQLAEKEQTRIRKEKVAAIHAAEKEEQRRAVNKARMIIQVRSRALFVKTYSLKRVSMTAAELQLSATTREAGAEIKQMYDLCLDPDHEVDPEPRLPRDVLQKRKDEAEALAAEAEEDAALAAANRTGASEVESVVSGQETPLLAGGHTLPQHQQAFHGLLRKRLEQLAGSESAKAPDSSRSGKSAGSRASRLLSNAASGVRSIFGGAGAKTGNGDSTTSGSAQDATAAITDARPAASRVAFSAAAAATSFAPIDTGTAVASQPQPPKPSFFSRAPLAQPIGIAASRQSSARPGDNRSVASTEDGDNGTVMTGVTGKTGKSDGFSALLFGGRKSKKGGRDGSESVSEGMSVGGGSEGLPSQITDEWAQDGQSVGSLNSMDSRLARSANRKFAMPSRAPLKVRFRYWLLQLVSSGSFGLLMMSLIVLNMVTMSLDVYPADPSTAHALEFINGVLTLAFALEMVMRMTGLGLAAYARDRMNIFDAVVVFVSLIDLAIAPPYLWTGQETRSTAVLALRTLRLARVFKLARSWVSLRVLIKTVFSAATDILYFSILLVLFLFIFGLLGIQLFSNRWRFSPSDGSPLTPEQPAYFAASVVIPRSNYDSTWAAMLAVFQLLTLDDWPNQLLCAYKVQGILGILFMVVATAIGGIVMLSLFLSVILSSFSGLDDPAVKAAHDALVQAELAEAAGAGGEDDPEYQEQLRLQQQEMEEEQRYEATMAEARADVLASANAAINAGGIGTARSRASGASGASGANGSGAWTSASSRGPAYGYGAAVSGRAPGTARSGAGGAAGSAPASGRMSVAAGGGSGSGGAGIGIGTGRVPGTARSGGVSVLPGGGSGTMSARLPPPSTAVFSSKATEGGGQVSFGGPFAPPTGPRVGGGNGSVLSGGTRSRFSAPPPAPVQPPSKLRLFFLRILAIAKVRAEAFSAFVNSMRDPNGLRVLIEFRRTVRRAYGTRRKVPGGSRSGGGSVGSSGGVRISSNGSVLSGNGGGSVRSGSVYTEGTSYTETMAASQRLRGEQSNTSAVAVAVSGAKTAAVAAANQLWNTATAAPSPSPTTRLEGNGGVVSPGANAINQSATKPAPLAGEGVAAAARAKKRLSAVERYKEETSGVQGRSRDDTASFLLLDDERDAETAEGSWLDRLSSLSDGSLSTHGRGTVGSDDESNKDDDDSDDEDEDDDDSSRGSDSGSGSEEGAGRGGDGGQKKFHRGYSDLLLDAAKADGSGGGKGQHRHHHHHAHGWRGKSKAVLLWLWNFFCCCVPVEAIRVFLSTLSTAGCGCLRARGGAAVTPAANLPGTKPTSTAASGAPEKKKAKKRANKPKYKSRTLFLFTDRHPLRRFCTHLTLQKWFDNVVLAAILISSLLLAAESPTLNPDSGLARILDFADVFFTVFFTFEMATKIISLGLVMPHGSYLKSGWNVLDGVIVVVSLFSLFTAGSSTFKGLKALRALRALRPLRVISRNPSLRLVVQALMRTMKPLLNVVLVCALLFLVFAIVTTSLFKGALYSCQGPLAVAFTEDQQSMLINPLAFSQLNATQQSWGSCNKTLSGDPSSPSSASSSACEGYGQGVGLDTAPTSMQVCLWFGAQWQPTTLFSFNNVGESMATLTAISTVDNWVALMWSTIDSRGVEMQPVRDNNMLIGLLWIVFLLFGAYLSVNLIIAQTVDSFQTSKAELGQDWLLSSAQQAWKRTQELLFLMRPKRVKKPPVHPTRRQVFWMVTSHWFEQLILTCIVFNTLVLAIPFFGMPLDLEKALNYMNIGFALLFTVECALKIYAFGLEGYLADGFFAKFDLFVVFLSDVGILLEFVSTVEIGAVATVVRLLRILRVLRLAHNMKGLQKMISSLLLTLPSLFNISLLLVLSLVVFSIAAVQLFGQVRRIDPLNAVFNFENFGNAMLTLWRCLSGEGWYSIMKAVSLEEGCTHEPSWDDAYPQGCGNPTMAPLFFYLFMFFNWAVLLQLLIAVVIESFEAITGEGSQTIQREDLEAFSSVFVKFDPDCTLFIGVSKLRSFLSLLPSPMGVAGSLEALHGDELDAVIASLRLPTYAGGKFVHFSDLALACARRVIAAAVAEKGEAFSELPSSHGISKRFEKLRGAVTTLTSDFGVEHFIAAEQIWSSFRVFKIRRTLALAKGVEEEKDEKAADAGSEAGGKDERPQGALPWEKSESVAPAVTRRRRLSEASGAARTNRSVTSRTQQPNASGAAITRRTSRGGLQPLPEESKKENQGLKVD